MVFRLNEGVFNTHGGAMYAIYGNMNYQYTPVLLAYMPYVRILWDMNGWDGIVVKQRDVDVSTTPFFWLCNGVLVCVFFGHRVKTTAPGTSGPRITTDSSRFPTYPMTSWYGNSSPLEATLDASIRGESCP